MTALAIVGTGVPCGTWVMAAPDCCPAPVVVSEVPTPGSPQGDTHVGHGAPMATASHDASHAITPPAQPQGHHRPDAPVAECCLAVPYGSSDDAPRLAAQAFVLHPALTNVGPMVTVGILAPTRPLPAPPPGGPPRYVLLSTFLI